MADNNAPRGRKRTDTTVQGQDVHKRGEGLGTGLMAGGILRFIFFDGAGLVIMLAAFIVLVRAERRAG